MTSGNGKLPADATGLPEAADVHGGVWFNGVGSLKAQIQQLEQYRQLQMHAAQMEVRRQMAIANLKAEADAAQPEFIACMRSSDYEGVARAARRISRAEAGLVNLGADGNVTLSDLP
jgi:hypothetical protein